MTAINSLFFPGSSEALTTLVSRVTVTGLCLRSRGKGLRNIYKYIAGNSDVFLYAIIIRFIVKYKY